jgi:hypothetical protein
MKRALAAVVGLALALVGFADSASASTTGTQRFLVTITSTNGDETSQVAATGPINGVGKFRETGNEDVVRFVFKNGSVTLSVPNDSESERFNQATCKGTFRFSGRWRIVEATGAYKGATGSGRFQGKGQFTADKLPDGSCSEDEDEGSFFLRVDVKGTVTLP